jgi:hypothetical protein
MNRNLVGSIYGRSSVKFVHFVPIRLQIWPPQTILFSDCLWWPCLLTDQDEMSNLYRGPSIDAFYQVSDHLAKVKFIHFVPIRLQIWPPQTILFSDWLISKKSHPLKPLCQINRNMVGSIYGRSSLKIAHFVPIH